MENQTPAGNGPRVDFGTLEVLKVQEGLSSATDIAVLKQSVVTTYAAAVSGNDKADSLFDSADFGDGQTYTSSRNTITKIPKNMTHEAAIAWIADKAPNGHIYRELSFNIEDVLTKPQLDMLASGESTKTIEQYKEDKAVKNAETGAKVLIGGRVQYRALHFSLELRADVDYRNIEAAPVAERTQISEDSLAAIAVEPTEADIKSVM